MGYTHLAQDETPPHTSSILRKKYAAHHAEMDHFVSTWADQISSICWVEQESVISPNGHLSNDHFAEKSFELHAKLNRMIFSIKLFSVRWPPPTKKKLFFTKCSERGDDPPRKRPRRKLVDPRESGSHSWGTTTLGQVLWRFSGGKRAGGTRAEPLKSKYFNKLTFYYFLFCSAIAN